MSATAFMLEALYGITTRQSLRLSGMARSLHEPIAMIKTENRLSRQASRRGVADVVAEFVTRRGAPRASARTRF